MVITAVRDQILGDLEQMSPGQQRHVAALVHSLVPERPQGASMDDLMGLAGTVDEESARQMQEAIEEGCGRIDLDEW